jgi:L-lactate permease
VAITAALLVGLGFKPLYAAGLCLIVNTAPVAFGAMGIPIIVAGQVSGVDTMEISQMVGRQLPFMVPIVLFWIMAIMDGAVLRNLACGDCGWWFFALRNT